MNVINISSIFSVLLVIVGGACALLLVSTKTLRDSRDDQEKRIKFLEEERTRDKETIASQETAVRFWRSAATGDEKLDVVTALLTEHHEQAQQNWILVNAGLGHVGSSIDHMNESIDRLIETMGGTS